MLQAAIDGAEVIVPAVWRLEVVNALVVAERRKKVPQPKTAKFVQDLQQFSITVDVDGIEGGGGTRHLAFSTLSRLAAHPSRRLLT